MYLNRNIYHASVGSVELSRMPEDNAYAFRTRLPQTPCRMNMYKRLKGNRDRAAAYNISEPMRSRTSLGHGELSGLESFCPCRRKIARHGCRGSSGNNAPIMLHVCRYKVSGGECTAKTELARKHRSSYNSCQFPRVRSRLRRVRASHSQKIEHCALRFKDRSASDRPNLD